MTDTPTVAERIHSDFSHHNGAEKGAELSAIRRKCEELSAIRRKCEELAVMISEMVPAGREQSLALTKCEETMFWANAGIARTFPIA